MEKTSKELLHLEHNPPSSFKDSALLVLGNGKSAVQEQQPPNPLFFTPLPSSQVLGKIKDFLGVISEANKDLELKAKDKPEDYNIENLNGNESELIEMDLMLGVADLHTPEAMAAAESAIAGNQPVLHLYRNDDSSESESSSDDEDNNDESESDDDDLMTDDGPGPSPGPGPCPVKLQPESNKRKPAKIIELP